MVAMNDRDALAYREKWAGRVFFLPEEITYQSILPLVEQMIAASFLRKPLVLVCDSDGGDLNTTLVFAEWMRKLRVPVYTVVLERAASGGVTVFAAGRFRAMKWGAVLLTHGPHMELGNGQAVYSPYVAQIRKASEPWIVNYVRDTAMKFKRAMETYAGQTLPDLIFRADIVRLDYVTSKSLGLVDRTMEHPLYELWEKPPPAK